VLRVCMGLIIRRDFFREFTWGLSSGLGKLRMDRLIANIESTAFSQQFLFGFDAR